MRAGLRRVTQRLTVLEIAALAFYAAGIAARFQYAIRFHHPRHYVTSDAIPLVSLAQTLIDSTATQDFADTVWPPGTSAVLALHLLVDPSLAAAAWTQFVLSSAVPLLIAHAAYMAWGRRPACYALVAASLHLGFIHYAGFFLSEQFCQFATALALWSTMLALAQTERRWMFLAGLGSGLAWGLAFAFRPNALPIALFIGCWLTVRWWRQRRAAVVIAAGAALGLILVVTPLAHRCSTLVGQFCPGSSNGAMNMALGHAREAAGIVFRGKPGDRGRGFDWYPPARLHHGYAGRLEVPAAFYDTGALLAWLAKRFTEDPLDFVVVSVGNAVDLFGLEYWPDDYARLPRRWAEVAKQLFFAGVLIPGIFGFWQRVVCVLRRRTIRDVDAALTAGVAGLLVLAAASMGEARYRMPFDGFLILLATAFFGRGHRPLVSAPKGLTLTRAAVVALLAGATLISIAILVVAHPRTALAARLRTNETNDDLRCRIECTVPIREASKPRAPKTPWDDPGNFQLRRRRGCSELRVQLEGVVHGRVLEVSSDGNDRYRATFYRRGEAVGAASWDLQAGAMGLRIAKVPVPSNAVNAGYDEIGISAIYGDGSYSIGHISLAW